MKIKENTEETTPVYNNPKKEKGRRYSHLPSYEIGINWNIVQEIIDMQYGKDS